MIHTMNRMAKALAAAAALALATQAGTAEAPLPAPLKTESPDLEDACRGREGWSDPAPPARIYGNSWYVGTCGITAILITSLRGHILIDGGPADAAPLIAANIQKLGFRLAEVKWIVSSHEHDDHVGGLAELKRLTGARVAAIPAAATALAAGRPGDNDPQRAIAKDFAPVTVDRVLNDRQQLRMAEVTLTAHATPAHAPGSASWTWWSCADRVCRMIAYADSATLISADEYRFTDHPERVTQAREGLKRIRDLPCDILVTPHPGASDLFARMAGKAWLQDPLACERYAEAAEKRFAERLAKERGK